MALSGGNLAEFSARHYGIVSRDRASSPGRSRAPGIGHGGERMGIPLHAEVTYQVSISWTDLTNHGPLGGPGRGDKRETRIADGEFSVRRAGTFEAPTAPA
jgi:hypothetical protein